MVCPIWTIQESVVSQSYTRNQSGGQAVRVFFVRPFSHAHDVMRFLLGSTIPDQGVQPPGNIIVPEPPGDGPIYEKIMPQRFSETQPELVAVNVQVEQVGATEPGEDHPTGGLTEEIESDMAVCTVTYDFADPLLTETFSGSNAILSIPAGTWEYVSDNEPLKNSDANSIAKTIGQATWNVTRHLIPAKNPDVLYAELMPFLGMVNAVGIGAFAERTLLLDSGSISPERGADGHPRYAVELNFSYRSIEWGTVYRPSTHQFERIVAQSDAITPPYETFSDDEFRLGLLPEFQIYRDRLFNAANSITAPPEIPELGASDRFSVGGGTPTP